jgi:hypothetical protein
MTAPTIDGAIQFDYNEAGYLERFFVGASLTHQQYQFIVGRLPWHTDQIEAFTTSVPSASFAMRDRKLTFREFWDKYDDKVRSSRKRTEKKWDSMSETEQIKAYLFIPKYFRSKGNAEKKYAETYLAAEQWNN